MTAEEQRIAIAEHLGAKWIKDGFGQWRLNKPEEVNRWLPEWVAKNSSPTDKERKGFACPRWVPNYPGDLNACAEMEKLLITEKEQEDYVYLLCNSSETPLTVSAHFVCATATAAQRCEAFLRTVGKWKEPK